MEMRAPNVVDAEREREGKEARRKGGRKRGRKRGEGERKRERGDRGWGGEREDRGERPFQRQFHARRRHPRGSARKRPAQKDAKTRIMVSVS